MPDTTMVSLQVNEAQKDGWDDYVDESGELQCLSHLIRLAVEKEINGTHSSVDVAHEEYGEEIAEVVQGVSRLDTQFDRISERLNDIEQYLKQETPEMQELESEVFDILPTHEELLTETHEPVVDVDGSPSVGHVRTGRIPHIAQRLGVGEVDVGEVLQTLQETTAQVHQTTIDGATRYYKEE